MQVPSLPRRLLATALALAALPPAALALQRGQLDNGAAYASGGIGQEEIKTLHAERGRYSLWVATLAKGTGAYLSDARLHVSSLDGKGLEFDQVMDGPWFFAALPPGRYKVVASWVPEGMAAAAGQTLQQQVTIRPGDHRQVVFRFAVAADVAPDHDPLFGGNPFGGPEGGKK
jgi:hypothetical protein